MQHAFVKLFLISAKLPSSGPGHYPRDDKPACIPGTRVPWRPKPPPIWQTFGYAVSRRCTNIKPLNVFLYRPFWGYWRSLTERISIPLTFTFSLRPHAMAAAIASDQKKTGDIANGRYQGLYFFGCLWICQSNCQFCY